MGPLTPLILGLLRGAGAARSLASLGNAGTASLLGRAGGAGMGARALPEGEEALNALVARHLGGGQQGGGRTNVNMAVHNPPAPHNMSALAGKPENFARLLSGGTSLPQIQSEDSSDRAAAAKTRSQSQLSDAQDHAKKSLLYLGAGATGVAVAMFKLPGIAEKFGQGILAGQEHLRRFNGEINNAFARLQRQQLITQSKIADGTSGTTRMLAESLGSLDKESKDIRILVADIWNLIGTSVVTSGRVANALADARIEVKLLREAVEWIKKKFAGQDKAAGVHEFLSQIAEGNFSNKMRDRTTPRRK